MLTEMFCDFCGHLAFRANESWLESYGFINGKPKINVICDMCHIARLQGNTLVRNFGIVTKEQMEKMNTKEKPVSTRRSKATLEELKGQLNWEGIEASIKAKTFKTSKFAADINANPVELKDLIVEHFGDKVIFKRGRNGGVFWVEANGK